MRRARPIATAALALCLSVISVAAPAAAQEATYQEVLESGDLASLIAGEFEPEELGLGSAEGFFTVGPQDREDGAAARAELNDLIAAAGLTAADTQRYQAVLASDAGISSITATRIPGLAAADWFELLYRMSIRDSLTQLGTDRDPTREIIEIGPKQVLRMARRGSGKSTLAYPQGEILWTATDGDVGVALLDSLETIDGPTLSTDPRALAAGESVEIIGTADDPLSQIPEQIEGLSTDTETFPVAALLDSIPADDADAVAEADAFRAALEGVGSVDDATLITSQAVGDDIGLFLFGLHVVGADQADFVDAFVELAVLPEFDTPELSSERFAGKDVVRISDGGSIAGSEAYVYGIGETAWILRGDDDLIAAVLRTMP